MSDCLRVFIVDDEGGMRLVLRRIIEAMDGFEVAGEAENGEAALKACLELKPDVVFLDVEMPVMSGTETAREIRALLPQTSVIFVTAYAEYMPEAFEVYAADYLVKPFRTDRVRQTLRKLSKTAPAKPAAAKPSAIMIKNKEGISIVPVEDVILVSREERASYIVTRDETYVTGKGLNDLWPYFDGRGFIRSHRAYIVKISEVTKIYPYGRWTYQIRFRGTEKDALITHDKLEELQSVLSL